MTEPLRGIGDHGIIGDMETAALVAGDATLDYLCWPSLDSPSIFADLLSPGDGGAFSITPALVAPRMLQLYLPETNVLMTRWMAEEGSAEVIDLMPYPDLRDHFRLNARSLIRQIRVTRGTIDFTVACTPRFDYAREVPAVEAVEGGVRFAGRALAVRLQASVPLEATGGAALARFTLRPGEQAWFVLGEDHLAPPDDATVAANITATVCRMRVSSSPPQEVDRMTSGASACSRLISELKSVAPNFGNSSATTLTSGFMALSVLPKMSHESRPQA